MITETTYECAYCISTRVVHQTAPATGNDAAWRALAAEHDESCEWIATRAHTLDLVSWRRVPLCLQSGEHPEGLDLGADDPRRVIALREYGRTGEMEGAWLCSAETLATLDDDDAAAVGPTRHQIDWTGFPS